MKHAGFWYLTGQEAAAGILGLPSNVGQWKNDFFFPHQIILGGLEWAVSSQILSSFLFSRSLLFFFFFTLFVISAIEAMSHFQAISTVPQSSEVLRASTLHLAGCLHPPLFKLLHRCLYPPLFKLLLLLLLLLLVSYLLWQVRLLPLLVKIVVLASNLLVFPQSCSILPKLLLTRENNPLMIVCSVRGNGLGTVKTTSLRSKERALWLKRGGLVM